jgi:hypothetical protein
MKNVLDELNNNMYCILNFTTEKEKENSLNFLDVILK